MFNQFKTGNPIWVYYTDIDSGANLAVPQLIRGRVGEEYHITKKDFPKYNFIKAAGDLTGTFDMGQHSVKLYYRNKNWSSVQPTETYLKINQATVALDNVDGMPVGNPIPEGIIIKGFEKVVTEDGTVWYEIGSDRWVKFEGMEVVNDPFNPQSEKLESRLAERLTVLPMHNVHGVVDYIPGKAIDVYDAPYGKKVTSLPNGQEVTITGQLNDNGEITWYQIGDQEYITGNYIQINNDDQE